MNDPRNIRISTLANGLRVVSDSMDTVETASVGVWVNAGARDESIDITCRIGRPGIIDRLAHLFGCHGVSPLVPCLTDWKSNRKLGYPSKTRWRSR